MTIAVCAFKGGVGKTTTAANLAVALSQLQSGGAGILALDLDRTQHDLAHFADNLAGVEVRDSTAGRLRRAVEAHGKTRHVVIDCAPALGRESLAALLVADVAVFPLIADLLSARDLPRFTEVLEAAQAQRADMGASPLLAFVLPQLFDGTGAACEILAAIEEVFAGDEGVQVWEPIARSKAVVEANNASQPVVLAAPRSAPARAYKALARAIMTLEDN